MYVYTRAIYAYAYVRYLYDLHTHVSPLYSYTIQAPPTARFACTDHLVMANELAVRTDRGEYVGGDTIYG